MAGDSVAIVRERSPRRERSRPNVRQNLREHRPDDRTNILEQRFRCISRSDRDTSLRFFQLQSLTAFRFPSLPLWTEAREALRRRHPE